MNRKLTRQICNEWRSNLWLILELAIVSVAIYYLTDGLMRTFRVEALPNGYDTTDVYSMPVYKLPRENDFYTYPSDSATRVNAMIQNFDALLKSIESRPGVESVAAGGNIHVFKYNNWGAHILAADKTDSVIATVNVREGTPELAEVLRLKPLAGADSPAELRKVLERGELIITRSAGRFLTEGVADNPMIDGLPGARLLVGKEVMLYGRRYTIGAVAEDTRRGYLEPAGYGNAIRPLSRRTTEPADGGDILVRVAPGRGAELEQDFKAHPEAYRAGEFYVPQCVSMENERAGMELDSRIEQRNKVIVIVFLLLTIFLGLLGTFWFRTANRTSEIAVRKSVGAGTADIFRRLVGEGLLLLTIATIPALVADYALARWGSEETWVYYGYMFVGGPWLQLALSAGTVYVLMALMTVAGIWLPARRAMRTDPAAALHAE